MFVGVWVTGHESCDWVMFEGCMGHWCWVMHGGGREGGIGHGS